MAMSNTPSALNPAGSQPPKAADRDRMRAFLVGLQMSCWARATRAAAWDRALGEFEADPEAAAKAATEWLEG